MASRSDWTAKIVAVTLCVVALAGCVSGGDNRIASPLASQHLSPAETAYSGSLRCLKRYTATLPIRIVLGPITDHYPMEGTAEMLSAAFIRAGVPIVDHIGLSVARAAPDGGNARFIFARAVPGSDFYLAGAVTRLELETASHDYRVKLGLDLRLTDMNTRELADVVSYEREMNVGLDAREPITFAARSAIERAVVEIVSRLYRLPPGICTDQLGGPADPLAGPADPMPDDSVASVGTGFAYSVS